MIPSGAVLGRLTREAAQAMHLVEGIPVVAGGGDRPLEALGSGIGTHGVMESTGTTSNVSAPLSALPDPIEGGTLCSRHVVPGYFLLEQGMSTTGASCAGFDDQFGHEEKRLAQETGADPYDLISEEAAEEPPGANGLIALPFFMGARATRWNPDARGVLFGLTLEHTKGRRRPQLDGGVALEVAACLDVLRHAGHAPRAIRVLGGGAKAGLVEPDQSRHHGAWDRGAPGHRGRGPGRSNPRRDRRRVFSDPMETAARLNPVVRRFEPDPERQPVYQELRQRFESLYAALRPLFDEVREL